MSKVLVIATRKTNHVLAAATRNVNADDAIDSEALLSNGLVIREKAPLDTLDLPVGAAESNLVHHTTIYFAPDQLTAHLVESGNSVLRNPRRHYVKNSDDSPELAAVQDTHHLTVNTINSNGGVDVTIPQHAFDQEPEILVWGHLTGAGSEMTTVPTTAVPNDPPSDVNLTLNFDQLQVNAVYTAMIFGSSLAPVIRKQMVQ